MKFGNEVILNIVDRMGMKFGMRLQLNTVPTTVTVQCVVNGVSISTHSMTNLYLFDIGHY